ncbi:hypothetical protein ABE10_10555 [Bacillus toyonensis]|nr:hypothetical protein [Bacillus toyonensis]
MTPRAQTAQTGVGHERVQQAWIRAGAARSGRVRQPDLRLRVGDVKMPRYVIATEAPLTESDIPCPSCGRWVRTTGDLIEHESVHVIDEAVAMGAVFEVAHPPGSYLGSVGGLTCGGSLPLPGDPGGNESTDRSYRESPSETVPERLQTTGGHKADHHDDTEDQVVGAVTAHDRESTRGV